MQIPLTAECMYSSQIYHRPDSWFLLPHYSKASYTIISYMILSFLPTPATALPGSAPVLLLFKGENQKSTIPGTHSGKA